MRARALVGWNVRRLRLGQGRSQENLGLQAGLEPSYVGRIERGRENITIETLEAIAAILEQPLIEFFRMPDAEAAAPTPLRSGRKRRGDPPTGAGSN